MRLLFSSIHCYLDPSSGAALCTCELLELLAGLHAACDCLVHPFRGEGFALPVVEAMACGLPVIVTGAGPATDYATNETAFLIPARRGEFAECRVGDLETIGRPWLYEPDMDSLVELLKRVASDRAGARAKGMAASQHIRSHFTWKQTIDAVEQRLLAVIDMRNQPRMNTDLHGWELAGNGRPRAVNAPAPNGFLKPLSDPCFIRVSSVAKNLRP